MKQGLFLYRVGIGRDDLVVIQRIQNAGDILADGAYAGFALGNQAAMRTEKTLHLPALCLFPEHGLF